MALFFKNKMFDTCYFHIFPLFWFVQKSLNVYKACISNVPRNEVKFNIEACKD